MIQIEDLGFSYNESVNTLNNLSLSIETGSTFGLLGPNGAGKSTLLNILTGLLPYKTGSIHINGVKLAPGTSSHNIALVPQDFAFYPQLTGLENLSFFAEVLGLKGVQARSEIERCVHINQLEDHLEKRAANYSGGLKRRLNLAIGLLNNPSILFLDEPTVGIDAQSRNFLLDSIKSISQSGTTIIYTSHYMEEVETLCDKIAIIDKGTIRLEGDLHEVLQSCDQGIASINTSNTPSPEQIAKLASIFTENINIHDTLIQVKTGTTSTSIIAQVLEELENLELSVNAIEFGHAKRLEQLFLDLTSRELRD